MQEYSNLTDRTYVEIDVNALRHNIQLARAKVGGAVKLMCMVKANAYGHGAVAVAKYCEELLDYLGVATVDEGIELRRNGVNLPILVVGDIAKCRYGDAIRCDIEMTLHSLEQAIALEDFCKSADTIAKVHIAVDTGMGRIGFLPNEVEQVIRVCNFEHIEVKGIFTHFAKADEVDKSYTHNQKRLFDELVGSVKSGGAEVGVRHRSHNGMYLAFPY